MKTMIYCITFLLCLFAAPPIMAREDDSMHHTTSTITSIQSPARAEDDTSEGVFMAYLIMFGAVFAMVCIGAGVVLASAILLLLFALVSAGVLSTAVVSGLYHRSWSRGFRTFVILCSAIASMLAGAIVFLTIALVQHWFTATTGLISGATAGLIGGIVLGNMICLIWRRLLAYFRQKLNLV